MNNSTTTTTMTRKRPFPPSGLCTMRSPLVRVLYLCASLALVTPPSSLVEAFGITTTPNPSLKAATRGKTSLSVCTLAPPPHHIAWLQSQEERERCLKKSHNKNVQQKCMAKHIEKKVDVLPLTMFEEATLGMSNATAKEAWAASFTTVEALRETFGRNRNLLWGDLDPQTTRRLYKTLLPRALLELYHCHGASSEDLAPLAYRARVAAKKYARERCVLPARVGATLFDGFRQFRKYGKFQATGMSYPQLWEKYATQIMQEEGLENEQDFTSAVCYKILQKSCESNKKVDNLFLNNESTQHDLQQITLRLEQDVYDLVSQQTQDRNKWAVRRYKILRTLLRIRRQMEGLTYTDKDDRLAMQAILQDAAQE